MDVRARTAIFLSRCLLNSELREFGFAPRHLKRYMLRAKYMLSLDNTLWKELKHRGWNGVESFDSDAPFIPEELKLLLKNPRDFDRFDYISPYLSSENTTWEAAYAAMPYIVEITRKLSPKERTTHLITIGFIVWDSDPKIEENAKIKPFLPAYKQALREAMPLLLETILEEQSATDTRYLLATIAALKGYSELGELIQALHYYTECPNCNAEIFELNE